MPQPNGRPAGPVSTIIGSTEKDGREGGCRQRGIPEVADRQTWVFVMEAGKSNSMYLLFVATCTTIAASFEILLPEVVALYMRKTTDEARPPSPPHTSQIGTTERAASVGHFHISMSTQTRACALRCDESSRLLGKHMTLLLSLALSLSLWLPWRWHSISSLMRRVLTLTQ